MKQVSSTSSGAHETHHTLDFLEQVANVLVIKRQRTAQNGVQNNTTAPHVHFRSRVETAMLRNSEMARSHNQKFQTSNIPLQSTSVPASDDLRCSIVRGSTTAMWRSVKRLRTSVNYRQACDRASLVPCFQELTVFHDI